MIASKFYQIMTKSYSLREILEMHHLKLSISSKRNGFAYTRDIPTITLCFMLESDNKSIEVLMVDGAIYRLLTLSTQFVVVDERCQFAALP